MENSQANKNANPRPAPGAHRAPNNRAQSLTTSFDPVNTVPFNLEPGSFFPFSTSRSSAPGPSDSFASHELTPDTPDLSWLTKVEFDEITQIWQGQDGNQALNNGAGKQ